jgi:Flp pilus assembly protein TadD
MQLGDLEAAQVSLQQALSLDKGDALTYFLLGCLLDQRGDSDTALRHFAEARRIDPRLPASSTVSCLPK